MQRAGSGFNGGEGEQAGKGQRRDQTIGGRIGEAETGIVRRQRVRLVQFRHLRGHREAFIKRKVSVLLAEQHFITSLGVTGGGIADGARLIERGTGGDLRQFGQNILTQRHGDSLSDVGGNMLSDQLNGTQRIPVRRLDRVHLKRNIGGAGQHAVLRQGGNNMLRIANVGIQLL